METSETLVQTLYELIRAVQALIDGNKSNAQDYLVLAKGMLEDYENMLDESEE